MRAHVTDPAFGRVAYSFNGVGANPTLVFARGSVLQATLKNDLPQPTTVHWHGLSAPSQFDGAGFAPVLPGQSFTYRFPIMDRAGLYWYHPHPHHFTAEQVYHGMAGLIVVRDQDDTALSQALGVTLGTSDFPVLLQDVYERQSIWQPYSPDTADCIDGFFGNVMYANGARATAFSATPGWVRLRLLNASTARGLLLQCRAQGHLLPFHILGTDGGLLPTAQPEDMAFLYPAERLDIAIDCRVMKPGTVIEVLSGEFANRHQHEDAKPKANVHAVHKDANAYPRLATYAWCDSRGDASTQQDRPEMLDDGAAVALFTVRITEGAPRAGNLPARLAPDLTAIADVDAAPTRVFRLDLNPERGWTIANKKFGDADALVQISRGAKEVWELHNSPVSMPHPMHLHGFHFQVLKRTALFGPAKALARHDGNRLSSDLGLKDSVTVWPNERVRIAIDFSTPYAGPQRYMLHCHNLEHEDAMMMLPVEIT
jgi:blue copper oxidase